MRKITRSAQETRAIAEKLAKEIMKKKSGKRALVLALSGELGAGKTTFVQGFFKGLGIKTRATSPTFIIFRRHRIPSRADHKSKVMGYEYVYHMDAYRLSGSKDLSPLGFNEIIYNPENILLVEWAGNIKSSIPKRAPWITLEHGKKEGERRLTIKR